MDILLRAVRRPYQYTTKIILLVVICLVINMMLLMHLSGDTTCLTCSRRGANAFVKSRKTLKVDRMSELTGHEGRVTFPADLRRQLLARCTVKDWKVIQTGQNSTLPTCKCIPDGLGKKAKQLFHELRYLHP